MVKDEKQLKKIENILRYGHNPSQLTWEVCGNYKTALALLRKPQKTKAEYETLCMKDARLYIKAMEFGALKYLGQLRLVSVLQQTDQSHYKNQ